MKAGGSVERVADFRRKFCRSEGSRLGRVSPGTIEEKRESVRTRMEAVQHAQVHLTSTGVEKEVAKTRKTFENGEDVAEDTSPDVFDTEGACVLLRFRQLTLTSARGHAADVTLAEEDNVAPEEGGCFGPDPLGHETASGEGPTTFGCFPIGFAVRGEDEDEEDVSQELGRKAGEGGGRGRCRGGEIHVGALELAVLLYGRPLTADHA